MRLDRKLNFVIPVETDNGVLYVHTTPLSREAFELYYLTIAQTFTKIYTQGITLVAGPRVAYMTLKDVATQNGVWEGPGGVENGLIAEIMRLSNVIMPVDKGWTTVPLEDAIAKSLLSVDDVDEVLGQVTFFTVASAMHKRTELPSVLGYVASTWGAQLSGLNSTEFSNSLRTSTETANSGVKETRSPIPS